MTLHREDVTVAEVRRLTRQAAAQIRTTLKDLEQATGITPVGVCVTAVDVTTFASQRRELTVGEVTIEMEPI